jgi:hypothetical protein
LEELMAFLEKWMKDSSEANINLSKENKNET